MNRTRRHIASLSLSSFATAAIALFCAQPLWAQGVEDFQLPENPSPTPTGAAVQGPVDDSGVIARPPRAVNTASPSPTTAAPSPTPAPTATPTATAGPGTVDQPRPLPRVTTSPSPLPRATQAPPVVEGSLESPSPQALPPAQGTSESVSRKSVPTALPPADPVEETAETLAGAGVWPWPWLLLAVLSALGLGWFVRRRKANKASPPTIEKPVVGSGSPRAVAAPTSGKAIAIKAEAVKLSRSMMNATLHYRLTLTNRTSSVLTNLSIDGDLVGASNGTPIEKQIAGPAAALEQRHEIKRMAPGQTIDLAGTMKVPLSEVSPIRKGNATLFVPMMRWRVATAAIDPVVRTFVVGIQPQEPGSRLQPFRLDEQPQTYARVAQRALD